MGFWSCVRNKSENSFVDILLYQSYIHSSDKQRATTEECLYMIAWASEMSILNGILQMQLY